MSITINEQTEARLREKAAREGQDINLLADTLLNIALQWEAQDHAEAVEGIRRGLEAFGQGRSRSFKEFAAEQRSRHSLSSDGNSSETNTAL